MCNEQVEFSYRDRGIYIYLYKHNDFDSNMYTESERTSEYSAYRNISKILMTRINNIQGKTANWKRKMKRMKRTNEPNVFCILYLYAGFFSPLYLWLCNNLYIYIYMYERVYKIFVLFGFGVLQYIVWCFTSIRCILAVSHIRTILLQTLYIRVSGAKQNEPAKR